jgi:hypothetical protein
MMESFFYIGAKYKVEEFLILPLPLFKTALTLK